MCESDGLSENEKLPGEKEAERGARAGGILFFATFFAFIGGAVCAILLRPRLPWQLLMAEALVLGVLGINAAMHFGSARQKLRSKYEELKHELVHRQAEFDSLRAFVVSFPISSGDVYGRLQAAALLVRDAHKAKVAFYRGDRLALLEWSVDFDEAGAQGLERQFKKQETELETQVVNALAEYRRLRDLAKWHGFVASESWKDYAGSVSPEVEGRNEPLGQ